MTRSTRINSTRINSAVGGGALALTLLLSACAGDSSDSFETSGDEESSDQFSSSAESASETETVAGVAANQQSVSAAPDSPLASPSSATAGRLIKRTAHLTLLVADVGSAIDEANEVALRSGGYLANEETSADWSSLVFKVPTARFDTTLDELALLGELEGQQVSSEDRTDVIVDLEARLLVAEASLDRAKGFLEEANDLTELANMEREVTQREAVVEALKGQLRTEEDSVSLSTISVTFALDPASLPATVDEDTDELPAIRDAFDSGLSGLVVVATLAALAAAWIAPWAPFLIVAIIGLRFWSRRASAKRAERQAAAAHPETGPPPPRQPESQPTVREDVPV